MYLLTCQIFVYNKTLKPAFKPSFSEEYNIWIVGAPANCEFTKKIISPKMVISVCITAFWCTKIFIVFYEKKSYANIYIQSQKMINNKKISTLDITFQFVINLEYLAILKKANFR